jgi:hypothetical protein
MAERLVGLPSTPGALRSQIASFARYPGGGIAHVTCVEVTGHDPDLELNVASGGSAGYAYWAVYRRLPGGWQFAAWQPGPGPVPIGFLHNDVVVTAGVFRPGDPLCCASGGYDHRELHWNGRGFVQVGSWRSGMPSLTGQHWGAKEAPVVISPGLVGPLTLGRSSPAEVRSFEGAPSNQWSGTNVQGEGPVPWQPPMNFSGALWLYSCGPQCFTIFGFTGAKLQAFATWDPRYWAFGRVHVGSPLSAAESVGQGSFSGFEVQCPGVRYRDIRGLLFVAHVSSAAAPTVSWLYMGTSHAGFGGCGS